MSGRPRLDKAEVFRLRTYGETLQAIAERFSVTRAAVSYALTRQTRRTNAKRERLPCRCGCGVLTLNAYASRACYYDHVTRDRTYKPSRAGQKRARRIVERHFTLLPGYVVHHVDGDNTHNALANLEVFASQAEHMSFHRGGNAAPIWRGSAEGEPG